MKYFLVGIVIIFFCMKFTVFQDEYNRVQRQIFKAKFDVEEAAAAAAQYIDGVNYSEGRIVFNRTEAIKAARFMIKNRIHLDDNFIPESNAYWSGPIEYEIEFFDDSNTTFPIIYENTEANFVETLASPSVVITLKLGKAKMSIFDSPELQRAAAHSWKGR